MGTDDSLQSNRWVNSTSLQVKTAQLYSGLRRLRAPGMRTSIGLLRLRSVAVTVWWMAPCYMDISVPITFLIAEIRHSVKLISM